MKFTNESKVNFVYASLLVVIVKCFKLTIFEDKLLPYKFHQNDILRTNILCYTKFTRIYVNSIKNLVINLPQNFKLLLFPM